MTDKHENIENIANCKSKYVQSNTLKDKTGIKFLSKFQSLSSVMRIEHNNEHGGS